MFRTTRIFSFALLTISVISITACDTLSMIASGVKPSANVVSTSISNIDLQGLQLNFGVEIQNPYSADIPLTQLAYSLASDGTPFVSGQLAEKPGSIPAMGSSVVDIPVRINFQSAMGMLNQLKPGSSFPYQADLTVSVDAMGIGNVNIPLSKSGVIPIPDIPQVDVESVEWEELSLTKAKALISLNVENPNDFALDLKNMDYSFSLGDNELMNSQIAIQQSLSPDTTGVITIPFEFNPMSMGMGLFNLIQGSGAQYEIKGNLDVNTDFGPLKFPVSKTGDVNFNR